MGPLISVVIPNYNRENVIYETVQNVLSQTYKNIEVIVVDDASTDHSCEELKKIQDDRFIYILSDQHRGANACRNAGVKASKGEYIAFQDSGTFWKEDKLNKQLAKLNSNHEAAMVYCMINIKKPEGTVCLPDESLERCYKEERCAEILVRKNIIDTPTIMIKRSCFIKIGGFDEKLLRWQDYDFAIRVVSQYSIVIVNEILAETTIYANSISMNYDSLMQSIPIVLKKNRSFYNSFGGMKNLLVDITGSLMYDDIPFSTCAEYLRYLNEQLNEVAPNVIMDYFNTTMEHVKRSELYSLPMTVNNFKNFIVSIHHGQSFVIYGAGCLASKLVIRFKDIGCIHQIKNLVVTHLESQMEVEGIPVISLEEFRKKEVVPILIGVSERTQLEIFYDLIDRGFKNVYMLQREWWKYID